RFVDEWVWRYLEYSLPTSKGSGSDSRPGVAIEAEMGLRISGRDGAVWSDHFGRSRLREQQCGLCVCARRGDRMRALVVSFAFGRAQRDHSRADEGRILEDRRVLRRYPRERLRARRVERGAAVEGGGGLSAAGS